MRLGTGEIILIFAVVLLLFGPKKLPELAKSIGEAVREFRRAQDGLESDLNTTVTTSTKAEDPKTGDTTIKSQTTTVEDEDEIKEEV